MIWLCTLPTPQRLSFVSANGSPLWCSCAECEAKEALIAGFVRIKDSQEMADIAVIQRPGGLWVPSMYCATCWPIVQDRLQYRGIKPAHNQPDDDARDMERLRSAP